MMKKQAMLIHGGVWYNTKKIEMERIKKIVEWLESKEPQFNIYFTDDSKKLEIATRLFDGKLFHLDSLIFSEKYGSCFIRYFHKDKIHVTIRHAKYLEKVTTRSVQINSL